MRVSVSELIDKLSIVNVKLFHLVATVEGGGDDQTVAAAARDIQVLNRTRSELKNEIDRVLGFDSVEVKV